MATFTHDYGNLLAGEFPTHTRSVTIASGENVTRGAVMGKVTADGKYVLSLSASGDGSQVPDGILAEDVDATGGDKTGTVYLTGAFNQDALTIGTGHTAASITDGLRDKGIFLETVKS